MNATNPLNSHRMDAYNVVWKSPSRDASESMPCGGGDIGLNVWVENGEVLFYLSRSGSLDELNEYLKLGRVRLRLDPNPFEKCDDTFRQELVLREGYVEIRGGDVLVRVWVEVHRPVIHVEVESGREINVTATYENWRLSRHHTPSCLLRVVVLPRRSPADAGPRRPRRQRRALLPSQSAGELAAGNADPAAGSDGVP